MKRILRLIARRPPGGAGYDFKEKDLGEIHKAAAWGDLSKLKQLARNDDIDQLDKDNRTALHIACACGHLKAVQVLVENKAKLNLCDSQNRTPLMKATQGRHERCVSILLENKADPNLADVHGNTALHLASSMPSVSIATLLLKHDANLSAQNKEGFAPLTVAVLQDHIEMAEYLLNSGADEDFLDRDQRSPLMIAAGNGQVGMLQLLLQSDADTALKDAKGRTANDHAVMNGHHLCSALILEQVDKSIDGPALLKDLGKNRKTEASSDDLDADLTSKGANSEKDDSEDTSPSASLSCCVLSEDATKRSHGSAPAQDPSTKEKTPPKPPSGAAAKNQDDSEDSSDSDSLSWVQKSKADKWPSFAKEPQKTNLKKLIESTFGDGGFYKIGLQERAEEQDSFQSEGSGMEEDDADADKTADDSPWDTPSVGNEDSPPAAEKPLPEPDKVQDSAGSLAERNSSPMAAPSPSNSVQTPLHRPPLPGPLPGPRKKILLPEGGQTYLSEAKGHIEFPATSGSGENTLQPDTRQRKTDTVKTDPALSPPVGSIAERDASDENEALKRQLEDAKRDLKLHNVTLTRLASERQARETLATEVRSVRTRLAEAERRLQHSAAALSDAQKALHREMEEHRRLKDTVTGEASSQHQALNSLSQKLTKEEARANSMENEVHRVTVQLTEKDLLLDVLRREKDHLAGRVKELERSQRAEKERLNRAVAQQEAQQMQVQRRLNSPTCSSVGREKELSKHQEVLSASTASQGAVKPPEEAAQRPETEDIEVEPAAEKVHVLQKDAAAKKEKNAGKIAEAMKAGDVLAENETKTNAEHYMEMHRRMKTGRRIQKTKKLRQRLRALLRTAKKNLWAQKKSRMMFGSSVEDLQMRLEEETHWRSHLEEESRGFKEQLSTLRGSRRSNIDLARKKKQLEEEVGDLQVQLEEEVSRRNQLEEANRELRDNLAPLKSLKRDNSHLESTKRQLQEELDDLHAQLERETSQRLQLEKVNTELKDHLASLKNMCRGNDQLERSKRQLEEEVLDLRSRMETQKQLELHQRDMEEKVRQEAPQKRERCGLDGLDGLDKEEKARQEAKQQMEQLCQDIEVKARQEIQEKLEEVNYFLRCEASEKAYQKQKIQELEGELSRLKVVHCEALSQRDSAHAELERYRQLYAQEQQLRRTLAETLHRSNGRLAESVSMLHDDLHRQVVERGSELRKSNGRSPVTCSVDELSGTHGQKSRTDIYMSEIRNEWDVILSKAFGSMAAEPGITPPWASPLGRVSREQEAVARAEQEYLEIPLQKYKI